MDLATTLQSVREWPKQDRLTLLFLLWDQLIDEGWQPEPEEELIAELERRLAAHEADPANVRTWEQVRERVRRPR